MDKNTCRLCLQQPGNISIFMNEALSDKIEMCTGIKLSRDDSFPDKICPKCRETLNISYNFRLQVTSSDRKLKEAALNAEDIESIEDDLDMNDYIKVTDRPEKENNKRAKRYLKPYQCDFCGKIFNRSSQLTVHTRTHTGEKPFACPHEACNKSFKLLHHLETHKRIHSSERPCQCLHCGKCFTDASSLVRHTKIHTNDRKYTCSQCTKKFITPGDLRKHNVVHTKKKPFECKNCPKKYSDQSSLWKHKKIHEK